MYHTLTWLIWLVSSVLFALLNQQPLQQIVFCLSAGMIFHAVSRKSPVADSWRTFVKAGMFMWGITLLFNLLTSHAGKVVLFTLPRNWPMIGGPITLESLLFGIASGLNLFALLLVFATFNIAVDTHHLLRWIPAGLFQAGVVISIAVAFIPQMIRSLQDIREAQRIRGHRFRGVRDLLPLFVPLLTSGLERSLTLAESMEARGFGGILKNPSPRMTLLVRSLTIFGFLLTLSGAIISTLTTWGREWGIAAVSLGVGCLLSALYLQGRQVRRTYYRKEAWRYGDTISTLCSALSAVLLIAVWRTDRLALTYYPYPPFSLWPGFNIIVGLAAVLLCAPAILPALIRTESESE